MINRLFSVVLFIVLLALWEQGASTTEFNFLFSSPSSILSVTLEYTVNGVLPGHLWTTFLETALGFVIGAGAGTLLGFLLWYSPFVAGVVRPYLFIIATIPVFAFAPMVILWFGIGIQMKVALAGLGTFVIAVTQAYEGARNVDPELIRLMALLKASRWQVMQKVILPASMSWVLNSLKLSISCALLGAFIGEFISADTGIGYYMIRAGSLYDTAAVFAGGIYLVLISLLFHVLVFFLERNKLAIVRVFSTPRVGEPPASSL